jgi:hypothetical protein
MPNDLPSTLYVPARFDWLQHLAERFSLFIDALSRQLSTVLGSWSRQPLLLGITPSKILLGLFLLVMGLFLAGIARFLIWKLLSLSRVRSITERYRRNDILFARSAERLPDFSFLPLRELLHSGCLGPRGASRRCSF